MTVPEVTHKCPKCGSSDLTVVRYPEHLFSYHEICNSCGWSDFDEWESSK